MTNLGVNNKTKDIISELLDDIRGAILEDNELGIKDGEANPQHNLLFIMQGILKSHPSVSKENLVKVDYKAWSWQYCLMQRIVKGKSGDIVKILNTSKVLSDSFKSTSKYFNDEQIAKFFTWMWKDLGVTLTKQAVTYFILGILSAEVWASPIIFMRNNEKFKSKTYNTAYNSGIPWTCKGPVKEDYDVQEVSANISDMLYSAYTDAFELIAESKDRTSEKVERVNRTVEELKAKQDRLKGELSETKSELTDMRRKYRALQSSFESQSAELGRVKSEADELRSKAEENKVEHTVIEDSAKLAELEGQITSLKQYISDVESDRDKCKESELESISLMKSLENRIGNTVYWNGVFKGFIESLLSDSNTIKVMPFDIVLTIIHKANIALCGANYESVANTLRNAGMQNIFWYKTPDEVNIVGKDCIVLCNDNSNLAKHIKEAGIKVVKYNTNQNSVELLCRKICEAIGKQIFIESKGE